MTVRWLAGDCREYGTHLKLGAPCVLLIEELVLQEAALCTSQGDRYGQVCKAG